MAAGTNRRRTFARPHGDLDTLFVWTEPGVLVDKSGEAVAAVQNRGQFHSAEGSGGENLYHKPRQSRLAFRPRSLVPRYAFVDGWEKDLPPSEELVACFRAFHTWSVLNITTAARFR
jgi:hypothetical protein